MIPVSWLFVVVVVVVEKQAVDEYFLSQFPNRQKLPLCAAGSPLFLSPQSCLICLFMSVELLPFVNLDDSGRGVCVNVVLVVLVLVSCRLKEG